MYIDPSYRKVGDRARLLSEPISTNSQTCLSFWYHMYGAEINTLRVLVLKGSIFQTVVWSRTGQSGNKWLQGQVTIPSNNAESQVSPYVISRLFPCLKCGRFRGGVMGAATPNMRIKK